MMAKTLRVSLLIGLFLVSLFNLPVSAAQDHWWDDTWSFRQEIILGFKTNTALAQYQPVDITIRFDSPCWTLNETQHSVRVICQLKNDEFELESQLYDLVHTDDAHISSCNLVFLIPPQADGTEQYYVYYDDSPTAPPDYPDHVSIEDSSYFYEPIPGYPLESHFYKISQNDSIRYVVAQEGEFLWYSTSQCVTKLKEGSTEVMPKNGEAIASFEFVYYYGYDMWEYNSTSQVLTAKDILCDGNLMVSCQIISRSTGGDLQTTAVYKYFYCPTPSERIQVHVIHKALKDCPVYAQANTDGVYASLQCGGMRSASIADLNFGKIYPYYHFYSEQDVVEEYQVDLNPDYNQENPVVQLVQTSDDVDIGKNAWVSFDEGTTGTVHALVFGSSSVVKTGTDERDGMQLKAYESDYPHLPGLDYTIAALQCSRNAYEKNASGVDTMIPQGFIAEFDAEFFSSPNGGYPMVEEEASIFQALVPMKPSVRNDGSPNENKTAERFSLMVYVHEAPSFPFGSALSAITGRNFPYVNVEVYHDNGLIYSGTAGRLPLKSSVSLGGSSIKDIFSAAVRMVDIRNLSLFKRFYFQQLEAGRYVIKIFKENPRIGNERHFIGYMVVDLTKDSKIHVFCKPEGSCSVSLVDQQGTGVSDAQVMLMSDGAVIAENSTDTNGFARLAAPCSRKEPYQLKILYHGFEVMNESIKLLYGRILFPLKKSLELDRYDWTLTLVDLWGLPPEIDIIPRLASNGMQTQTVIRSEQSSPGIFHFTDLLPSTYQLQIQYKSFVVEKEIKIPSNDESLVFPAEFSVEFRIFDSRGMALSGVTLQMSRGGKTQETVSNGSVSILSLPPGLYLIKTFFQGTVIGQRSLTVMGERSVDMITNQEPIFPLIFIVVSGIMVLIGLVLSVRKKDPLYFLLVLAVSILIVALIFPWWSLQGSSSDIETSSTLFLFPLDLISRTTTSQVIAGELTFFPQIFTTVMTLIPAFTVIIGLLAIPTVLLNRLNKKQWQSFLLIAMLILLFCSLVLFVYAMSAFTEVGVGSFIGQGTIDVSVQGEDAGVPVLCQWGPGFGFWLYVISGLVLITTVSLYLYQNKKKR
ncbi:MAG TPA: carboxypeptidase regulatory-like domain-containing protein [Thermoplasmata archaeon]|nr:MAG TPA: carboxypeptidase regulatory-like domain-containing protein [Thermoplasmata archaeon]